MTPAFIRLRPHSAIDAAHGIVRSAKAAPGSGFRLIPLGDSAVLAEFGTDIPDDTEGRVLDSTADIRYLVIPRRPDGTDGMSEEDLAALVTRDSMIGTGLALPPEEAREQGLLP